ncbi:MAG: protein translocase subunit SecF [Patescibacteria group bacterium]
MYILAHKRIFLSITSVFVLASIAMVGIFGFNSSIDFQGGSVYEVAYEADRPSLDTLEASVKQELPTAIVQLSGEQNVLIKDISISEENKKEIQNILSRGGEIAISDVRFKSLGPAFSAELVNKSLFAIALVIVLIIIFIAYAFRGISQPVSSFKYGLTAVVALAHDTIIPVGVFALLGSIFIDYQIDVLFVTAILATLGYSVNDTIVIFDRIREILNDYYAKNKSYPRGEEFAKVVGQAVRASLRRSLMTSTTTFVAMISLAIFGGPTTAPFAYVLAIGVIAGTYSSLALAPILLIIFEHYTSHDDGDKDNKEDHKDDGIPDDVKRFLAKQ